MFPEAPIFTLIYDREAMHGAFEGRDIRTSFPQKIPLGETEPSVFSLC